MAHHARHGPHDAKRATPRHTLRAIKQRVAARVQYEHNRALHTSEEGEEGGEEEEEEGEEEGEEGSEEEGEEGE